MVEYGRFNGCSAVLPDILSAVVAGVVFAFAFLQRIERIHELQIVCARACMCIRYVLNHPSFYIV